jgi:hypothetical protein
MPFPVSCPACGKSFSIADDAYAQKIKGRVVSVKCKQCQTLIRVDGTRPLETSAAPPVSAPADPALSFLVDTPGATDRELTALKIALEIRAGRMTESTLVWREGMAEWLEAGKVSEIASSLKPPGESTGSPRPARLRPMQMTLPMGMMAPPSLAARGITLPLSPPTGPRPQEPATEPSDEDSDATEGREHGESETETERQPAVDESAEAPEDESGESLPPLDSLAPDAAEAPPPAPAPRAAPLPKPAGSAPRAAPAPASAPRASAVPIPTPLPRPASSPLVSAAPLPAAANQEPWGAGEAVTGAGIATSVQAAQPTLSNYPVQRTYPEQSIFPGQQGHRAGSAFPTTPAPPGLLPQSIAPAPPAPRPYPASFPATAPIDDVEFRPKRGKTIGIVIAVAIVVMIVIAIAAASGGGTPAPVPVPTVVAASEPRSPLAVPTRDANLASPPANRGANSDPLSAPAAPARTSNEFTNLFATGAKRLGSAKPTDSAAPGQ